MSRHLTFRRHLIEKTTHKVQLVSLCSLSSLRSSLSGSFASLIERTSQATNIDSWTLRKGLTAVLSFQSQPATILLPS